MELWSEFSFQEIDTNSTSHSESLWYNSHIRITNDTLYTREFNLAGINEVGDHIFMNLLVNLKGYLIS